MIRVRRAANSSSSRIDHDASASLSVASSRPDVAEVLGHALGVVGVLERHHLGSERLAQLLDRRADLRDRARLGQRPGPTDDIPDERFGERREPAVALESGVAQRGSGHPQDGAQGERSLHETHRAQVALVDLDDAPPFGVHVDLRHGQEDRRAGAHRAREELEFRPGQLRRRIGDEDERIG